MCEPLSFKNRAVMFYKSVVCTTIKLFNGVVRQVFLFNEPQVASADI